MTPDTKYAMVVSTDGPISDLGWNGITGGPTGSYNWASNSRYVGYTIDINSGSWDPLFTASYALRLEFSCVQPAACGTLDNTAGLTGSFSNFNVITSTNKRGHVFIAPSAATAAYASKVGLPFPTGSKGMLVAPRKPARPPPARRLCQARMSHSILPDPMAPPSAAGHAWRLQVEWRFDHPEPQNPTLRCR